MTVMDGTPPAHRGSVQRADERRLRVLMIQPALATYRIDLLNALGGICDFKVVFLRDHISYHASVRQDDLQRQLTCDFEVLSSNVVIWQRDIPAGLWGLILAHRPDVLVTHEYSLSSAIGALARQVLGCGFVIWSVANPEETLRHGIARSVLRRLLAVRADALVFYSRSGARAFAARFGLPEADMFTCANHQAEPRLRGLMDAGRGEVQREIERRGLRDSRILLYVGRLAPEKCVDVALRAFAVVVQSDPGVRFVIIGDGPAEASLRGLAVELGVTDRAVFLGHRQGASLYGWYAAASLLLLPSAFEPYGAVIAEALGLGVPVVCSRVAGASELVVEGENGWLCEPDVESVLRALRASAAGWRPAGQWVSVARPARCGALFTQAVENFASALAHAARKQRDDDAA